MLLFALLGAQLTANLDPRLLQLKLSDAEIRALPEKRHFFYRAACGISAVQKGWGGWGAPSGFPIGRADRVYFFGQTYFEAFESLRGRVHLAYRIRLGKRTAFKGAGTLAAFVMGLPAKLPPMAREEVSRLWPINVYGRSGVMGGDSARFIDVNGEGEIDSLQDFAGPECPVTRREKSLLIAIRNKK